VAVISVYSYILCQIISTQHVDRNETIRVINETNVLPLPIFGIVHFLFLLGWLKVALCVMNPFGDDYEDFECSKILDSNLDVSYGAVLLDEATFPESLKMASFVFTPMNGADEDNLPNYIESVTKELKETELTETANEITYESTLIKDWFDEKYTNISNLLEEKNRLRRAYMDLRTDATKGALFRCHRLVHQRLRELQDARMVRKAEEIQGYVYHNNMKNVLKAIKAIYGPCFKGTAQQLSSDGRTLLTEKSQVLKRSAENFRSVLNCSSATSDNAINLLPQVDTNNDLDLSSYLPETIQLM
ncbi:unnamed protein product, partial [Schistocephalus solidus]|uniref:Bestrophin homolog n=1 Tax=Schistocephalus solidus TaxID=70667 RepID=A0A183TJ40_SCHSO